MSQRILPSFLKASVLAAGLISPSFGASAPSATPPTITATAAAASTPNKKIAEVIIYSSQRCPHCESAKKIFDEKNIPYKVIELQWKKEQVDEMEKKTGKRSVPQILINGKHVGGYMSLVGMDLTGELDDVLSQCAHTTNTRTTPPEQQKQRVELAAATE